MEFRLLGPVRLTIKGVPADLGPPRRRAVLAALLSQAGLPVSAETLIDRVWGEQAPRGARNALHSHIARIRRLLADLGDRDVSVERRSGGYLIAVDPDRVDLIRYRGLVQQARDPSLATAARVELLRRAHGLWCGEPLGGVAGDWAERVRSQLVQQRLATLVLRAQLELELGEPEAIIDELRAVVTEHPFAEPPVAALMRALFLAGRAAEAPAYYAALREHLAEELGSEPGPELRALHDAIGRGDAGAVLPPSSDRPAALPVPAQLPADLPVFSGRAAHLRRLDALVPGEGADQPATVVISAIAGTAGVGKTTLAVHWAHRVADRFADGQLYINLRGLPAGSTPATPDAGGASVAPAEALRGFLGALGVPPERVPDSLDARLALYRSRLAGRRVLVLLDNAHSAEQVRPLLPGTPGCMAVVTSRNQLAGLVAADGAHPLALDLLTEDEARQLLRRRIGPARIAAEPRAVDEIVARCARLPLALAIVAARAATQPVSLAALAAELRAAQHGLDPFDLGDAAIDVRTVFSLSYRTLSQPAARLFRLLGLHAGPDLTAPTAASLAGVPVEEARRSLAELVRASLVAEQAGGRFGFHDLLRAYAVELTGALDPEPERRSAIHRVLDHYLHAGHAAELIRYPQRKPLELPAPRAGVTVEPPADERAAVAWLTAEHPALVAAVHQATRAGFYAHAWRLVWTFDNFQEHQGRYQEAIAVGTIALDAAIRVGDVLGQILTRRNLSTALSRLGRYDEARAHLMIAHDLYAGRGDQVGQAHVHRGLAYQYDAQGRQEESRYHEEEALRLYRITGNRIGQAHALNGLGWSLAQLGDFAKALECCQEALTINQENGDRDNEADTWDSLGYIHHCLGDHGRSAACYGAALELYRRLGMRRSEAETFTRLGDAHRHFGAVDRAREAWQTALDIYAELGHPDVAEVRGKLDSLDPAVVTA